MHPDSPRPKPAMVAKVRAAIQKKYGSISAFAMLIGKNRQGLVDVLIGRHTSTPSALLLAAEIGAQPWQVWPHLYAKDGRTQYAVRRFGKRAA